MQEQVKGTVQVEGEDRGDVMLYALSTCVWCKKVKRLLDSLGVAYRFVFVDELDMKDLEKVMAEVKKWNPKCSFPTLVVNGEKCIVGFREDELKEVLGK